MQNHYTESWLLYKLHTESFVDDYQYYLDFTRNHSTLELFAGYGRLTNYLVNHGIDIETVELERNFARFISLPDERNHIENVLNFKSNKQFERVIAGYNSFCLLTLDDDIHTFFSNLSSWLSPGGLASLSYYHPDSWLKHSGTESEFVLDGNMIKHISKPDLSRRNEKIGMWLDEYIQSERSTVFNYPTRIYESRNCITPYLSDTNLRLKSDIRDYNITNMQDNGWIEFVFEKLG